MKKIYVRTKPGVTTKDLTPGKVYEINDAGVFLDDLNDKRIAYNHYWKKVK